MAIGTYSTVKKNGGPIRAGEAAGAYTYALSPKDRRDIGRALSKAHREAGSTRERIQAEYQSMIAVLTAETFDRAAAKEVLDRQFEFANDRRVASETLLLDHLESMTLEERKAFAERLKEGANRKPRPPRP